MDEFLKGIFTAPITSLFIIAGIFFLFIAVVGNVKGKIEPGVEGRIASGVLGLVFVLIGLTMHLTQERSQMQSISNPVKPEPAAEVPQPPAEIKPETPGEKIDPAPVKPDQTPEVPQPPAEIEPETPGEKIDPAPVTADKEPNDYVPDANLIAEGTSIRGSIATRKDRDFYQFNASSSKTRVILRKLSLPGLYATVEISDAVERYISGKSASGDQTITLSFESNPGSIYFIVVKPYDAIVETIQDRFTGEYELVVRKEG